MSSGTADLNGHVSPGVTPRKFLVVTLVRVLAIMGVTLVIYGVVPVEGQSAARAAFVVGVVGVSALLAVFTWQMSRVSHAEHPVVAAVEALVLVFGLFTCFFALVYVSMSAGDSAAFTEPVTKVAGLYFTVTVLTTVGFGDITAVTDTARMFVTIQMAMGAVLVAVAVKALAFSARQGRGQAPATAAATDQAAQQVRPGAENDGPAAPDDSGAAGAPPGT